MIPELVKAALAAYVVVGLVTIIAGGCKHHIGIGNAQSDRERRKRYKAYYETTNRKNMGSSFVEKVAKMRTLQNEYAKTRNSLTLKAAKKAEKEVDEALTLRFANFTPASEDEQHPKLFDV